MEVRNKKGFTLIELIVVIAIIGVLAGIATPSVFAYITASQQRADQTTASQIRNAVLLVTGKDTTNQFIDNTKGGFFWSGEHKTKLRDKISESLGMGKKTVNSTDYALIPRPKENSHGFYMYLLPPYTVLALPATSDGLYKNGALDTAAMNTNSSSYIKSRLEIYGQFDSSKGVTVEGVASVASGATAAVASASGNENHIGWLNMGIDYGLTGADNIKP